MLGRAGGQRVLNEDLGMDGGSGPQNWMEFWEGSGRMGRRTEREETGRGGGQN